ncbi:ABC transporter ATP-binding protein [Methanotorris formicicus]|nr:ATP-binding cassette domain-containing protein [Methanotorris formicicus]
MIKVNVKNLIKHFGDKKAVDGISFEVYEGEIFGLLGHNGAGKTTTLRTIAGIINDYDGKVEVNGRIGYLPEERGLYKDEKVKDVLAFFGGLAGMRKEELKNQIEYWLKKLNVYKYKNQKIKTLSKGNQQKIQFIVSVLHNPDIVILDEPFSGLDVFNINLLKKILFELKDDGKSIILSTHQLEKIEKFCYRVLILKEGKVVHYGRIDEICHKKVAYIEYVKDGKLIKQNLPYKEAISLIKNEEILKNLVKFEVRNSLEDLFLEGGSI